MNRKREEIDLEVYYPRNRTDISGEDRLKFAKQLLLCLFFICSTVFVFYGIYPENKALINMFELVKIGALPLVTLVISFYFPKAL